MPLISEHIETRFPHWFRGRRATLARPLLRTLGRWAGLEQVEAFLRSHGGLRDFDFIRAAIEHLGVRYDTGERALAGIPATGRLLIVANHPSGALDALALLDAVGRVRHDVRIVANDVLSLVAPIRGLLLPVDVFGGRTGADRVRAIGQALAREECVIVFPAGEVSRLGLRGVRDSRWRQGFVRFARHAGAPVLPVHIRARNSMLFYGASALYKPAATALLARELFHRRAQHIALTIGSAITLDPARPDAELVRAVRRALYALGRPRTAAAPAQEPLAPPEPVDRVVKAIAATELLGTTFDGKQIRVCVPPPGIDPHRDPLLREIGRLREVTFRSVGEGTGRARDLDAFDAHYEHILVWDPVSSRIAGAYRVARGADVLARRGIAGLYTASLFHYGVAALPRIAQGLELGRSFVIREEWGSRSLDYLWQGIGAYLRRHPSVRYLFGAVSISAALPPAARDQIVGYYTRYYADDASPARVASRRPFRYVAAPPDFGDLDVTTAFGVLRANLAALGATLPMLYRQYTELCEPGGARFLAFGVDPEFADSIDGLVEVDLNMLLPKKRDRYLRERRTESTGETE